MPFALRLWILGVGLAALGLGLGGWMRLDREVQRDRFPPTPGWVDARGQVDLARFPTRIPVVDAQGRHGGWIDLREEPFFMVPPPPGTPAPCRYRVRSEAGHLIGYWGSESMPYETTPVAPEGETDAPIPARSQCSGSL
jgi:hypothetical protein